VSDVAGQDFGEEILMPPPLVWLIMVLCLLISVIKYTLALILKFSVPGAKVERADHGRGTHGLRTLYG
jgi:hypothetical protein